MREASWDQTSTTATARGGEDFRMKVFCTDQYVLPLPKSHTFPIEKYALLRQRVAAGSFIEPAGLCAPHRAADEEIERAHEANYLRRVQCGNLSSQEIRRIGFPWSPELVERARRSSGATMDACRTALTDGIAASLAGGTHHAFRDHGEGFCVFNDSVIAARVLQVEKRVRRVIVIDCDVHQGNGTAAMTANDPTVFTFSIHGKNNFPVRKETSDMDIALDDGTDDPAYLEVLERGLRRALGRASADLAIYLAGADPYFDDRYGHLTMTKAGLAERDRIVFGHCREKGLPLAITMAGGYARRVEDTVDIHVETVRMAARTWA